MTFKMVSANWVESLGSISKAAPPATSGSEEVLDVITGAPSVMASNTGRPKPS